MTFRCEILMLVMLVVGLGACGLAEPPAPGATDGRTTIASVCEPPPFEIAVDEIGMKRIVIDTEAFERFCAHHEIAQPVALDAVDFRTYQRIYEISVAAAMDRSAANLGALGMIYDALFMPETAIECYREAVLLDPEDFRWFHLLGRACAELGKNDEAISAFERAVILQDKDVAGFARLGDLLLNTGHPDQAAARYQHFLNMRPNDPYGLFGLARTFAANGDIDAAIGYLRSTLEIEPRNPPAHYMAARLLSRVGRDDEARQHLEAAKDLPPDAKLELRDDVEQLVYRFARTQSYLLKAIAHYRETQQYEKAYEAARDLAERRWRDVESQKLATWFATVLGRSSEAAYHARVVVRLQPNFAPGWEAVARGLSVEQRYEEALLAVDRAIECDPNFVHARILRGIVLLFVKRTEQSLIDLDAGLAAFPNDPDCRVARAVVLLRLGRSEQALRDLHAQLTAFPDDPDVQIIAHAIELLHLGRTEDAGRDLEAVLRIRQ